MARPINRWEWITRIIVGGVPCLVLVYLFLTAEPREQAGLGWIVIFLGMIAVLFGVAAGRIVGWLTR